MRKVQPDIAGMFEEAGKLYREIGALNIDLSDLVDKGSFRAREEIGLQVNRPGESKISFRLVKGNKVLHYGFHPSAVWVSEKDLKQFAQSYVDGKFTGTTGWQVELLIDGNPPGPHGDKAFEFWESLATFLRTEPAARDTQRKAGQLRELGRKACQRIDQELKKL